MLRLLVPYINKKKLSITIYQLFNLLKYTSYFMIPLLISKVLGADSNNQLNYFYQLLLFSIIGITSSALSDYYANTIINGISNEFALNSLMNLLHAPYEKINKIEKASSLGIINNCSFLIPNFFIQTLSNLVYQILIFILAFSILFNRNSKIALLIMLCVIGQYSFNQWVLKNRYKIQHNVITAENDYKQNIHLLFKNWKSSKSQGLEKKALKKIEDWTFPLKKVLELKNRWLTIDEGEKFAFSNTLLLLVILCLVLIPKDTRLQITEYELFFSYTFLLINALSSILSVKSEYMQIKANYDSYVSNLIEREVIGGKTIDDINQIEFQNVSFAYGDNTVINNKNYSFKKGNLYVLKGHNGCGKSTILDLVSALYTPDKGQIKINGIKLADINTDQYRKDFISLLEQKTVLLGENLIENLMIDTDSHSKLLDNYLAKFSIESLKNIDSISSNTISGGQLQKIGILRALMKSAKSMKGLILLDEPMNHLDNESKKQLVEELRKIKENNIVFIISHDESFDEIADQVIVFL